MKKKILISVILLTFLLLFITKCSQVEHKSVNKETFLLEKIDSKIIESKVTKEKIKVTKVKVRKAKLNVDAARVAQDTIQIINTQDSLIKELEVEIEWYDTLSSQMDIIITDQAEVIEIQKSTIVDLNEDVKDLTKEVKKERRRTKLIAIVSSVGLILLLILK